jgi:hypothetical protein
MPMVSDRFTYPVQTTLDGSGYGICPFTINGSNVRITNRSISVSSSVNQSTATTYRTVVSTTNRFDDTQSGSTGANLSRVIDMVDGDTILVEFSNGDAGATATVVFSGFKTG